jgi:alkylation response protein AidB-like acyl-CoA dehydrogenase/thiazole synthase ThiGH ThiG subunit/tetratricopeptide (TPR) repeat protein
MVCTIIWSFLSGFVLGPTKAHAQTLPTALNLPAPGTMVSLSSSYTPVAVTGITLYPNDPFQFDFIVNTGDDRLEGQALDQETMKLIKYFLASLTIPEEEMWVNLSPYEKDRIIAQGLSQTQMGQDMLAQDYLLKQLTASLMYPENGLGAEFWKRVYNRAQALYGTTDIPVDTFNKIWIVPDKASVYTHGQSAFVVESHLKVMVEKDYVASRQSPAVSKPGDGRRATGDNTKVKEISAEIVREVLIPEIEREVNEGKNFAPLRQIFHSMILATWYKKNLRESVLGQVYADQNKISGVESAQKDAKEKIYHQYIEAFKKGVYNYIKEEKDIATQEIIPRKYFSGGIEGVHQVDSAMLSPRWVDHENQYPHAKTTFRLNTVSSDAAMVPEDQRRYQPGGYTRPGTLFINGKPMRWLRGDVIKEVFAVSQGFFHVKKTRIGVQGGDAYASLLLEKLQQLQLIPPVLFSGAIDASGDRHAFITFNGGYGVKVNTLVGEKAIDQQGVNAIIDLFKRLIENGIYIGNLSPATIFLDYDHGQKRFMAYIEPEFAREEEWTPAELAQRYKIQYFKNIQRVVPDIDGRIRAYLDSVIKTKQQRRSTDVDAAMLSLETPEQVDALLAQYNASKNLGLTEDEIRFRQTTREFVEQHIPLGFAVDLDEANDIVKAKGILVELAHLLWPQGKFRSPLGEFILIEEVARRSESLAIILDVLSTLTANIVEEFGTDEQKRAFLDGLLRGDYTMAYALTSSISGSDSAGLKMTAQRDGEEYVLNGVGENSKIYITGSVGAKYVIAFARTADHKQKGIAAFIVPLDAPGVDVVPMKTMGGLHGSGTAQIHFDHVRVPAANLLWTEGQGFTIAMKALSSGRLAVTSVALGSSETSLDEDTAEYKERLKQKASASDLTPLRQAIPKMIADAFGARRLLVRAARAKEEKKDFNLDAAVAKLFTTERAIENGWLAKDLIGLKSLRRGHILERTERDDRVNSILEGTSEIMRNVIKAELMEIRQRKQQALSPLSFQEAILKNIADYPEFLQRQINALLALNPANEDKDVNNPIERMIIDLYVEGHVLMLIKEAANSEPSLSSFVEELWTEQLQQVEVRANKFLDEAQKLGKKETKSEKIIPAAWSDMESMARDSLEKGVGAIHEKDTKEAGHAHLTGTAFYALSTNRERKQFIEQFAGGMIGVSLQQEYREQGFDEQVRDLILGAVAQEDLPLALMLLEQEKGLAVLQAFGDEAQKENLDPFYNGKALIVVAVDDVPSNPVKANPLPGESKKYLIQGQKQFVINGLSADLLIVLAPMAGQKELSAFLIFQHENLVPSANSIALLGLNEAGIADVLFNGVGTLIGQPGQGLEILETIRRVERSALKEITKGAGQALITAGRQRAQEREAFGKPIIEFAQVAEMLNASQRALDDMDEANATRNLRFIANRMVQLHGGSGYDFDTKRIPTGWLDAVTLHVLEIHRQNLDVARVSNVDDGAVTSRESAMLPETTDGAMVGVDGENGTSVKKGVLKLRPEDLINLGLTDRRGEWNIDNLFPRFKGAPEKVRQMLIKRLASPKADEQDVEDLRRPLAQLMQAIQEEGAGEDGRLALKKKLEEIIAAIRIYSHLVYSKRLKGGTQGGFYHELNWLKDKHYVDRYWRTKAPHRHPYPDVTTSLIKLAEIMNLLEELENMLPDDATGIIRITWKEKIRKIIDHPDLKLLRDRKHFLAAAVRFDNPYIFVDEDVLASFDMKYFRSEEKFELEQAQKIQSRLKNTGELALIMKEFKELIDPNSGLGELWKINVPPQEQVKSHATGKSGKGDKHAFIRQFPDSVMNNILTEIDFYARLALMFIEEGYVFAEIDPSPGTIHLDSFWNPLLKGKAVSKQEAPKGRSLRSFFGLESTDSDLDIAGEDEIEDDEVNPGEASVDTKFQKDRVIPVSVDLSGEQRALLLSGPNMAGKTETARAIALAVVLNQAGLPLPVGSAKLSMFRHIYSVFPRPEQFQEGHGYFGTLLKELAELTKNVGQGDLVILDEVPTGTDYHELVAVTTVMIEDLIKQGATIIITGHLKKAFELIAQRTGQQPYMQTLGEDGNPNFHISKGIANRSYGIELTQKAGFPKEITTLARSYYDTIMEGKAPEILPEISGSEDKTSASDLDLGGGGVVASALRKLYADEFFALGKSSQTQVINFMMTSVEETKPETEKDRPAQEPAIVSAAKEFEGIKETLNELLTGTFNSASVTQENVDELHRVIPLFMSQGKDYLENLTKLIQAFQEMHRDIRNSFFGSPYSHKKAKADIEKYQQALRAVISHLKPLEQDELVKKISQKIEKDIKAADELFKAFSTEDGRGLDEIQSEDEFFQALEKMKSNVHLHGYVRDMEAQRAQRIAQGRSLDDRGLEQLRRIWNDAFDQLIRYGALITLRPVDQLTGVSRANIKYALRAPKISQGSRTFKMNNAQPFSLSGRLSLSPFIQGGKPQQLEIDPQKPIQILTGPNSSGKTALMLTVYINLILASHGMYVPADLEMGQFNGTYSFFGGDNVTGQGESYFFNILKQYSAMLKYAKEGDFVIIDELHGSDNFELAAIQLAVLHYLRQRNVTVLYNTHIRDGLKLLADRIGLDLWKTDVAFDDRTFEVTPSYTISPDPNLESKSYGLAVARQWLSEDQFQRAQAIYRDLTTDGAMVGDDPMFEDVVQGFRQRIRALWGTNEDRYKKFYLELYGAFDPEFVTYSSFISQRNALSVLTREFLKVMVKNVKQHTLPRNVNLSPGSVHEWAKTGQADTPPGTSRPDSDPAMVTADAKFIWLGPFRAQDGRTVYQAPSGLTLIGVKKAGNDLFSVNNGEILIEVQHPSLGQADLEIIGPYAQAIQVTNIQRLEFVSEEKRIGNHPAIPAGSFILYSRDRGHNVSIKVISPAGDIETSYDYFSRTLDTVEQILKRAVPKEIQKRTVGSADRYSYQGVPIVEFMPDDVDPFLTIYRGELSADGQTFSFYWNGALIQINSTGTVRRIELEAASDPAMVTAPTPQELYQRTMQVMFNETIAGHTRPEQNGETWKSQAEFAGELLVLPSTFAMGRNLLEESYTRGVTLKEKFPLVGTVIRQMGRYPKLRQRAIEIIFDPRSYSSGDEYSFDVHDIEKAKRILLQEHGAGSGQSGETAHLGYANLTMREFILELVKAIGNDDVSLSNRLLEMVMTIREWDPETTFKTDIPGYIEELGQIDGLFPKLEAMAATVEDNEEQGNAHARLCAIYAQKGRMDKAIEMLSKIETFSLGVHKDIFSMMALDPRYREAILENIRRIGGDHEVESLAAVADIALKTGAKEEAAKIYDEAWGKSKKIVSGFFGHDRNIARFFVHAARTTGLRFDGMGSKELLELVRLIVIKGFQEYKYPRTEDDRYAEPVVLELIPDEPPLILDIPPEYLGRTLDGEMLMGFADDVIFELAREGFYHSAEGLVRWKDQRGRIGQWTGLADGIRPEDRDKGYMQMAIGAAYRQDYQKIDEYLGKMVEFKPDTRLKITKILGEKGDFENVFFAPALVASEVVSVGGLNEDREDVGLAKRLLPFNKGEAWFELGKAMWEHNYERERVGEIFAKSTKAGSDDRSLERMVEFVRENPELKSSLLGILTNALEDNTGVFMYKQRRVILSALREFFPELKDFTPQIPDFDPAMVAKRGPSGRHYFKQLRQLADQINLSNIFTLKYLDEMDNVINKFVRAYFDFYEGDEIDFYRRIRADGAGYVPYMTPAGILEERWRIPVVGMHMIIPEGDRKLNEAEFSEALIKEIKLVLDAGLRSKANLTAFDVISVAWAIDQIRGHIRYKFNIEQIKRKIFDKIKPQIASRPIRLKDNIFRGISWDHVAQAHALLQSRGDFDVALEIKQLNRQSKAGVPLESVVGLKIVEKADLVMVEEKGHPNKFVIDGVELFPLIAPTALTHLAPEKCSDALCIQILSPEIASDLTVKSGTQIFIFLPGDLKDVRTMVPLNKAEEMLKTAVFQEHAGVSKLGREGSLDTLPNQIQLPYVDLAHRALVQQGETRKFITMINTSRAQSAEDAVLLAGVGISYAGTPYLKLEIRDDDLMTRNDEVMKAVKRLVALNKNIKILPLIGKGITREALNELLNFDQVVGLRIEGTRPGSGQGLGTDEEKETMRRIISWARELRPGIPLVAETGIGKPDHAKEAMGMGFNAVLVNAAITQSDDPVQMAVEFASAVTDGAMVSQQLKEILTIKASEQKFVEDLDIAPDGGRLATLSLGEGVSIWDPTNGSLVFKLKSPKSENNLDHVEYSPDGQLILGSSQKGAIVVWDANTGKINFEIDADINVYDYKNTTEFKVIEGQLRIIRLIYSKFVIQTMNVQTGEIIEEQEIDAVGEGGLEGNLAMNTAQNYYLYNNVYDYEGTPSVMIRNIVSGEFIFIQEEKIEYTTGDFSPDGKKVILGNQNGEIEIWELDEGGKLVHKVQAFDNNGQGKRRGAAEFSIIGFLDGEKYFYAANFNGEFKIWDSATKELVAHYKNPEGSIDNVAFNTKTKKIAVSFFSLREAQISKNVVVLDFNVGIHPEPATDVSGPTDPAMVGEFQRNFVYPKTTTQNRNRDLNTVIGSDQFLELIHHGGLDLRDGTLHRVINVGAGVRPFDTKELVDHLKEVGVNAEVSVVELPSAVSSAQMIIGQGPVLDRFKQIAKEKMVGKELVDIDRIFEVRLLVGPHGAAEDAGINEIIVGYRHPDDSNDQYRFVAMSPNAEFRRREEIVTDEKYRNTDFFKSFIRDYLGVETLNKLLEQASLSPNGEFQNGTLFVVLDPIQKELTATGAKLLITSDILNEPGMRGSVSLVAASHVTEHFDVGQENEFFLTMQGILKEGGVFIVKNRLNNPAYETTPRTSEIHAFQKRNGQLQYLGSISSVNSRQFVPKPVLITDQVVLDPILFEHHRKGFRLSSIRFNSPQRLILENPDPAMVAGEDPDLGGIDLNPQEMKLETQGEAIQMPVFPQGVPMPNGPIEGFRPVIINTVPVTNFLLLLGLSTKPEESQLTAL